MTLRDRALAILHDFGASDEQAESVLRDFYGAGIRLSEVEPPAEPQTGPKADDDSVTKQQAIASMRAITKGAKP